MERKTGKELPPQIREIIEFLKLENSPTLTYLQKNLGFEEKLEPWWERKGVQVYGEIEFEGPVDPVSLIQEDLRQYDYSRKNLIEETTAAIIDGEEISVPPYKELVEAAAEYLVKIGFKPVELPRGENWVWPEYQSKSFSTIYEKIVVWVERNERGVTTSVHLLGYN